MSRALGLAVVITAVACGGHAGSTTQQKAGPDPFANVPTSGSGAASGSKTGVGGKGSAGNVAPVGGATGSGASGSGARDGGTGVVQLTKTCGASRFGASPEQVDVLLVLDKSGSMMDTPTGFGSDKWTAMKAAIASALDVVKDRLWLGLELFPMKDCSMPSGSTMDVDVQDGAKALPLIRAALDSVSPSGGTPTTVALNRALEYFTNGQGAQLPGRKFVLLATDGGPNCHAGLSCGDAACTVNLDGKCPSAVQNCCDPAMAGPGAETGCLDDQETLSQIKALAVAGVDTFVVGIPGTEAYSNSLDAFAQAGGRPSVSAPPSYFAVDAAGGTSGLTSVLTEITTSLITSCRFQLASQPPDLSQLNVQIDNQLIPKNSSDGWNIDSSTDPATIVLQGPTCTKVEMSGAQDVAVLYGCPTLIQ